MSTAEFFCLWVLMKFLAPLAVGIGAALLVEHISWLVDMAGL